MAINKKAFILMNHIILIFTIFLCCIFVILSFCNLILIIRGLKKTNVPPSIFGTTCLVVETNSMSGESTDHIEIDDLIFIKKIAAEKLAVNDVIAFIDEETIITHRIVAIDKDENGDIIYITKGDANNILDNPIKKEKIIGKYYGKIPKIGRFIILLQNPLICIFLTTMIAILIIGLILNNYKHNRKKEASTLSIQRKNKKNKKEEFNLWKEKKKVEEIKT